MNKSIIIILRRCQNQFIHIILSSLYLHQSTPYSIFKLYKNMRSCCTYTFQSPWNIFMQFGIIIECNVTTSLSTYLYYVCVYLIHKIKIKNYFMGNGRNSFVYWNVNWRYLLLRHPIIITIMIVNAYIWSFIPKSCKVG